MKQFGKFLILASALLLSACGASQEQEAKDLVNSFYQTHQSNRPDGALSLRELITFRHFLSVPLFDLLKDVSVAEEAHQAETEKIAKAADVATDVAGAAADTADTADLDNPEPPLVDGDPFTTHPKGASTYRVLGCEVTEQHSSCAIELIYSDAKLQAPFKSVDHVLLNRDARGWVIDNIEYGGNTGNSKGMHQGNLQQNLQAILKNSERRIVQ